ncbi:MAG TPA: hypothetical protein DDW52_28045 [Planctomycetaceae bacterium]|nr:hypothetical protein [Planctomycetaceae bacterium]
MNRPRSIEFELPFGFEDEEGNIHRQGRLRIPTQKDLTVVLKIYGDVQNPAYLETLMLVRILESLGNIELDADNRQQIVESLPLPDIEYLNSIYQKLLSGHSAGPASAPTGSKRE